MPIIMRNAPRSGAALVATHVTNLLREKRVPAGMPMAMRAETLAQSDPHPVFTVTLDDLAAGKLLTAAKQTSWRYLLVQSDVAVAEAEISAAKRATRSTKAKEPQFLSLTHGPFSGATVEALHAAEALPQTEKADYELRLLKIPAVYLVALWLHGAKEDILIPMGNPPGGLKANMPYSEADVLHALRDVVARTRQFQQAYDEKQRGPRGKKR